MAQPPQVHVNRHGSIDITGGQGSDLASDLISWGKRRDKRLAAAIKSKAEEKDDNCTFQPQIFTSSGRRSGSNARRGERGRDQSWSDRREQRLRDSKKEADARVMAECTFQPKLKTSGRRSGSRRRAGGSSGRRSGEQIVVREPSAFDAAGEYKFFPVII